MKQVLKDVSGTFLYFLCHKSISVHVISGCTERSQVYKMDTIFVTFSLLRKSLVIIVFRVSFFKVLCNFNVYL